MIDQLLALRMTTYLQNEMDYLPWKSAIKNLEYMQGMLGKTGFYGLLEVCDNYSLNSTSHVVLQWCAIINVILNDKSEISRDEAYSTRRQHLFSCHCAVSSGYGRLKNLAENYGIMQAEFFTQGSNAILSLNLHLTSNKATLRCINTCICLLILEFYGKAN